MDVNSMIKSSIKNGTKETTDKLNSIISNIDDFNIDQLISLNSILLYTDFLIEEFEKGKK